MKKKIIISLFLVLIMFFLNMIQKNTVYANNEIVNSGGGDWSGIFSDAREFLKKGKISDDDFDEYKTKRNQEELFVILSTIGIAITVIIGGILGIKFMIASAEDKAKIKEAMIPYVVGCIVIYGAFFIWQITVSLVENI